MRTKKKASAMLGIAAALVVAGVSAVSAFAFEAVDILDRSGEVRDGIANYIADQVYAEPGETVDFRVFLENNPGYAGSGVALTYDSELEVVMKNETKPVLTVGPAAEGLTTDVSLNSQLHILGFATMATSNNTDSGVVYTAQFVVPADAAEGTEYPMTLGITKLVDEKTVKVDYVTVPGWIKVGKKPTETTSETTVVTSVTTSETVSDTTPTTNVTTSVSTIETISTNTTTVSTNTTSVVTDQTTASETSTNTNLETDVTTASNTSKTTKDPTSDVTTASGKNGGQTTAKPGSGSNTPTTATKTGDAGVGVAVAALMIAGAVAYSAKKSKD